MGLKAENRRKLCTSCHLNGGLVHLKTRVKIYERVRVEIRQISKKKKKEIWEGMQSWCFCVISKLDIPTYYFIWLILKDISQLANILGC